MEVLTPVNDEIKKLLGNNSFMEDILKKGKEKAIEISDPIINETKRIVGYF